MKSFGPKKSNSMHGLKIDIRLGWIGHAPLLQLLPIKYELKSPSVEMACDLGIQYEPAEVQVFA
jgi:hypothetical protein